MAEKFPLVSISDYLLCYARVAQLVEHQTFNLGVAGSNPATGTISTQSDVVYRRDKSGIFKTESLNFYAVIAQQVEHFLGKEEVASSNLANSSKDSMYSNHYW